MQYSSFTKRLLAAIIDIAVINLAVVVLGNLFIGLMGFELNPELMDAAIKGEMLPTGPEAQGFIVSVVGAAVILSVVSVVAVLVVDAIMPATKMMGSPGKYFLGMAVVGEDGQKLRYGRAMGRHAAKFLSGLSVIGLLMPLWSVRKQALHDRLVNTVVVRKASLKGIMS